MSGDFFSIFPIGEKAAGVFICDVMGHGVRSALITSIIRALVEEHAKTTTDPRELLTGVNQALTFILKQAETTMFATCFYMFAAVQNAQFRFANAGHPAALHVRSAGAEKLQSDGRNGPAMEELQAAVSRHAALAPQEFFTRVWMKCVNFPSANPSTTTSA